MDDPADSLGLLYITFQPLSMGIIIGLVVLIILLLCSALVSGAEVAFFSIEPVDRGDLEKDDTPASKRALQLLDQPKRLLATILVSNNFINVGIVIVSAYVLEHLIHFEGSAAVRFLIEVVAVTLLLLILGEVMPKIYATEKNIPLARAMSYPLFIAQKTFPINVISKFLVSATSIIDKKIKSNVSISVDDLSNALDLVADIDESDEEHKILKGIIAFGEISVKQVMKPRLDVTAVEESTPYSEVLKIIRESGYSRLPVYKENFDKMIGILYIKDLLRFLDKDDRFRWQKLARSPFFVPEQKKLDDLLKEFQQRKIHMAVVVDEYGGTSGIVTLEDVLEEIVGDINDEFDEDDLVYTKINDTTYVFQGKTSLTDLCKVIDVDLADFEEGRGDSDSLAGFVIEVAGKIPLKGERIKYKNYTFTIEAADKRRVKSVKLSIENKVEETHE